LTEAFSTGTSLREPVNIAIWICNEPYFLDVVYKAEKRY
jgi:hypothetical protein